jgi:hypothetical protein
MKLPKRCRKLESDFMEKEAKFLELAAFVIAGGGVVGIGIGTIPEQWGWALLVLAVVASAERVSRTLLKK